MVQEGFTRNPKLETRNWPEHAHFLRLPFLRKSKLVARKQGRCAEKASAGKEFAQEIPRASARWGGPIGRPACAPTTELPCPWEKNRLPARPRKWTLPY